MRDGQTVTVLDVHMAEFWKFLERSAEETTDPAQRLDWLAFRLSRVSVEHIADFQLHLDVLSMDVGDASGILKG
ncbi:DUF4240 domain-containing protein [Micromonospora chersina]|uniref:DUF4240 domain-containing protein n=1 Tax=Micromonospora chersina TaxID=47854 RepID=UPI00345141B1